LSPELGTITPPFVNMKKRDSNIRYASASLLERMPCHVLSVKTHALFGNYAKITGAAN
jgi:hypothetical protein